MKIISNALYEKIPLFDRLDALPYKKLVKLAIKKYGMVLVQQPGENKYDIIGDIGAMLNGDNTWAKLQFTKDKPKENK